MFNVPKYSNPQGYIYSEETIRRLASLKPAAPDFLLMWDNAYCIHELEGDYVPFPDILAECARYGNADMVFEFASTSKVTLPGAGISCFACSEANLAYMEKLIGIQAISFDMVKNMLLVTAGILAGVTMTGAGATFPYGKDPQDSNIRIAPSLPPVEELEQAIQVLCACLRLSALEEYLK